MCRLGTFWGPNGVVGAILAAGLRRREGGIKLCCWAGDRPLPSTSGGSGHNAQGVGGEVGRSAGPQSAILTLAGDTCSACSLILRQHGVPVRGLTARALRSSPAGPFSTTAVEGAAFYRQSRARP